VNGSVSGGTVIGGIKIHFGTGNDRAEDYYFIRIGDMRTESLGIGSAYVAVSTQHAAQLALELLNTAMARKENARAALGAIQNRLENTISNMTIQSENVAAAESRISDVDVATR
jgi:flagellin